MHNINVNKVNFDCKNVLTKKKIPHLKIVIWITCAVENKMNYVPGVDKICIFKAIFNTLITL